LEGLLAQQPVLSADAQIIPPYDIQSMRVSERFIDELTRAEGTRKDPKNPHLHIAYQDLGDKGVWTIGYGHTGKLPDGTAISKGKTITEAEARALLAKDVEVHSQFVRDLVKVPLTQRQFEAIVDF